MAMGTDYSFELISIETYALQFIGHNKSFLGSVISVASRPAFKAWRIVGVKKTITYYRLALIFWTCKVSIGKNV